MHCLPRTAGLQRRKVECTIESLSGLPLKQVLSEEEEAFVQVSWKAGSRRGLQKTSLQKTKAGQRFGDDAIIWSDGITHHDLDFSPETQQPTQRCLMKIKVMKRGSLGIRVLATGEVNISDIFNAGNGPPAGIPHRFNVLLAATPTSSLLLSMSLQHSLAVPLTMRWRQGLDAVISGQGLRSLAGSLHSSSSAGADESFCPTGPGAISWGGDSSPETTETDIQLDDSTLEAHPLGGLKRSRRSHRRASSCGSGSGSDCAAPWEEQILQPTENNQQQQQKPWWASQGKRAKRWSRNDAYDDSISPLHQDGTDSSAAAGVPKSQLPQMPLRRWLASFISSDNGTYHKRLADSPSKVSEASDTSDHGLQLAQLDGPPADEADSRGQSPEDEDVVLRRVLAESQEEQLPEEEDEVLKRVLEESACMARGLTDSSRDMGLFPSSLDSSASSSGGAAVALSMGQPLGQGWFSKQLHSRGEASESASVSLDVFYATMDQRSWGVGGAAACSSLAVSVSEWVMAHQRLPVLDGELDGILRTGSQQWRQLCSVPLNKTAFPDSHFDLETAVGGHSGVRGVSINPTRSFVGFMRPQRLDCPALDDLLESARPLDSIWQEISREVQPATYIVGWNDHWFVVHIDSSDRCFLIDTLGDKLCEGGDRAFVLRFPPTPQDDVAATNRLHLTGVGAVQACQAFFEQFYIAAPVAQLAKDIRRAADKPGSWMESIGVESVLRRLQIDFHCVELL